MELTIIASRTYGCVFFRPCIATCTIAQWRQFCMCSMQSQDASVTLHEPVSTLRASELDADHEDKQPTHAGKVNIH